MPTDAPKGVSGPWPAHLGPEPLWRRALRRRKHEVKWRPCLEGNTLPIVAETLNDPRWASLLASRERRRIKAQERKKR